MVWLLVPVHWDWMTRAPSCRKDAATPKDRLAREGVDVTWMVFYHLTGGYGAALCTVQAISRR